MTQEDKELLLKDLCGRLYYGLKYNFGGYDGCDYTMSKVGLSSVDDNFPIEDIKPYLFPLSSMTDEQKNEYHMLLTDVPTYQYEYGDIVTVIETYDNWRSIDYLNANYFDYRGLIEKGLAIDATELNIY